MNVTNDQVRVTVDPAPLDRDTVRYYLPKLVQGTYEISDYGKFVDNLRALDNQGNELDVRREDKNTWAIIGAQTLDRITYWVNDTYDVDESQMKTPGYPSGTNIDSAIFVLNLPGFIGYFDELTEISYEVDVTAPTALTSVSPLQKVRSELSSSGVTVDSYLARRYFELTDKPLLYGGLDVEEFDIEDVRVTLAVYSPTNQHQAKDLKEKISRRMTAQKAYLEDLSNTNTYDIYIYLTPETTEAERKYGALEHTTSTLAVFPEEIDQEELISQSADIIAHEFFHTVTPLSIHSEKIHFFDYQVPTFSEHIWFYEGVTEYFSEHFRVQQQLYSPDEYFKVIGRQLFVSQHFNDSLSFTKLSEHIIESPYADNFVNVYFKGPLIALCIDILLRQESEGQRSLLSVMKELSRKYGRDKYFYDTTFIDEFTSMTYPSIGDFLVSHVVEGKPIDYDSFLNKVGLNIVEQNREEVVVTRVQNRSDRQRSLFNNWLTE